MKTLNRTLQTHLRAQVRVFLWLLAAMVVFLLFRHKPSLPGADQPLETRLAAFLTEQTQLKVAADDVAVPALPTHTGLSSLSLHPVFFLGQKEKEPRDLYLAWMRLAPNGMPLALSAGDVYNLSRTDQADEGPLTLRGSYLAVVSRSQGQIAVITVYDLAGKQQAGQEFSWLERKMEAVTNLQETGQSQGLGRKTLTLTRNFGELQLGWTTDH